MIQSYIHFIRVAWQATRLAYKYLYVAFCFASSFGIVYFTITPLRYFCFTDKKLFLHINHLDRIFLNSVF